MNESCSDRVAWHSSAGCSWAQQIMMRTDRQDETETPNVSRIARSTRHAPDDNLSAKLSTTSKSRGSSVPPRRKTREGKPDDINHRASRSSYSDHFTMLAFKQDRPASTQPTEPKYDVGSSVPPKQAQRRDKALKHESFSVSSKTSKKSIKSTPPKCSTYAVDCATKSSRNNVRKTRQDAMSNSSQSGRFTNKSTGESALSVAIETSKKKSKRRNKDIDEGATRNTQASKKSIISSAADRIKKIIGMSSRQKKHRHTDETLLSTPMDVLHIPVKHVSRQDLPACVMGVVETNEPGNDENDQSLTLGTPKRDANTNCSDSESDTTVSCLNAPILDTSQSKCASVNSKRKLQSRKSKSHKHNDDGPEVFDLPWSNGVLHGKYSGPISTFLQPHGRGTLIISGVWENGVLVFPKVEGLGATVVSRDAQTTISIPSAKANKHIIIPVAPCARTDVFDGTAKFPRNLCRRVHCSTEPHPKYRIGEVARSPNDMIIHRSDFDAIDSASMIQKMQRAFIKRSNGLWTCAVLVERAVQPINGKHWYTEWEIDSAEMELEESMLFAINADGSTKIVNKRNWGKFVRRMKANMNDALDGVSDNKVDSRNEDLMESVDLVDDNAEDDVDLVEYDSEEVASQHSVANFGKEVDKVLPGGTENGSNYENEESNQKMDATRESQYKRGIGDDIDQINDQEKRERDTMKTIFEDKIICANRGDEDVLFARKSTSTASTSLTWSSLSNSTSSKSMLLSNSMLSDID